VNGIPRPWSISHGPFPPLTLHLSPLRGRTGAGPVPFPSGCRVDSYVQTDVIASLLAFRVFQIWIFEYGVSAAYLGLLGMLAEPRLPWLVVIRARRSWKWASRASIRLGSRETWGDRDADDFSGEMAAMDVMTSMRSRGESSKMEREPAPTNRRAKETKKRQRPGRRAGSFDWRIGRAT